LGHVQQDSPLATDKRRRETGMNLRPASAYAEVEGAIVAGRCVLLDGGVATELPHQYGHDRERLWGVETLSSTPNEVLEVHRRYVDAGVDVVTTNTWALPALLEDRSGGRPERKAPVHWMEIARRGVRIAREAIAEGGRVGEVAVAFSLNGDVDGPDGPETIALLARALASDPPELFLLETLSVLTPSLFDVVSALLETRIPVWLSFRRCPHGLCGVYGQHWGGPEGDAFGRAARRFEEMGVGALMVNCIPPDHVDGMVSYLRDFTDIALGVYPNLGYYTNAGWQTETEIGGSEYAEMALRWRAEGAQIIGGCCGTRPEHIGAARTALANTPPGRERHEERTANGGRGGAGRTESTPAWNDRRGRALHPLEFPSLVRLPGVSAPIPGSYLMWRYLFEHNIGAQQRCLDIGSGLGLQTVQLALNGATHVHAIDLDKRAVTNTLENAFRQGVAERVTAEVEDVYPWIPDERYEVVVANVPQTPIDPRSQLSSHRPTDYWGRGLVDQVLGRLPRALAPEGRAFLTLASLLSREKTLQLLAAVGLSAEVVGWELQDLPATYRAQGEHIADVEQLSDGYILSIGEDAVLVTYLLEIYRSGYSQSASGPPWSGGT
jgi:S-methylmethionine-dependent homocysteine/selenocysteine methylase/SAM-dependent methyltransferase